MLFNSIDFMLFFPVAVLGYYLIPKKIRYIWLLVCSYYFYMSWNVKYAALIMISTVLTYAGSCLIGSKRLERCSQNTRKLILGSVITANIGILAFFKYSNFFIQCINTGMDRLGFAVEIPKFDILLPVGISFYTFQALSYSIDVYRGTFKPERNILKYALFVSFFPQLVAGPIERSGNLLSQIQEIEKKKINFKGIYHGLLFMLWGLFLKMVIADRAAILVDRVFDNYYLYGGIELAAAAVLFALQIYCDFMSYSTIAMGAAEVLGFSLMDNFNAPYLSCSIKEFWRRWHISLSTWFRDYLYIPLGGSRCSKARTYFNLMVTFLVSGLWHGASVNYIVWGGIHGIFQVMGELTLPVRQKTAHKYHINTGCFSFQCGQVLATFVLTDFAWIFFRSEGIWPALSFIKRIFVDFDPWALFNGTLYTLGLDRVEMNILLAALLFLIAGDLLKYFKNCSIVDFLLRQNVVFQYLCVTCLILAVLIFGVYGPAFDAQAFIYFQF